MYLPVEIGPISFRLLLIGPTFGQACGCVFQSVKVNADGNSSEPTCVYVGHSVKASSQKGHSVLTFK